MWSSGQRVLVLAPHTDDGEFGCGATMARFLENGYELFYVAFSGCEDSLPPEAHPDTLRRELREAMKVMELPESNINPRGSLSP